MKRLFIFFSFIFVTMAVNLKAQDENLSANQLYDMANAYAEQEEYQKAIEYYQKVLKLEPDNYQVYIDLGYCYMYTLDRFKAIDYLEKAVTHYKNADKINTPQGENALYYLGIAYNKSYEFDLACQTFDELLSTTKSRKMRKMAEEKKEQCKRSKEFFNNPKGLFVTYLNYINSPEPDHSPVLTLDERYLYFTSRRKGSSEGHVADDGLPYEDIYYVDRQDDDPKPINIGTPINTPDHEATCDISSTGDELLIYKSSKGDEGSIYYSKKVNGKWTTPEPLPDNINTRNRESHASFSKDGRYLYFTSNRPGGYGGQDIYVAERDENGNWVNVKNLGPVINTKEDEEGPFLAPDGKTLYFSSKGHKTMGGYDVFKSVMNNDGTWSEPINLGFPLNTVDDDVFFYPTVEPNKAFYASTQQTGEANIYIVEIYEDMPNITVVRGHTYDTYTDTTVLPLSSKHGDTVLLGNRKIYRDRQLFFVKNDTVYITYHDIEGNNIFVYDSICKVPANTRIFDYNVATKKVIEIYNPAHSSGKYSFAISTTVEHLILYKAPNYVYDLLKLPAVSGSVYYDAELDTMIRGNIRSVKQTQFAQGTSELGEDQKLEILILADFMNRYPFVWVELSAYPDNASKKPQDDERLAAIGNYLLSLGIDSIRIKYTYSDTELSDGQIQYVITDIMSPEIAKQPQVNYTFTKGIWVSDINFQINQGTNAGAYPSLDLLADYLKNNPKAKVGIYGYTDTQGPKYFNVELAKKRAQFVKQYLINKGVNPNQIVAEGKGYTKQVSINKDKAGNYVWESLKYNRRAEIHVLQQGDNEMLFVRPVQVPDRYKLPEDKKNNYPYSVMVITSETPLSPDMFDFNVVEMRSADGMYNYIHGEFNTKEEAEQFANSIKEKFPKAYVFINDYRH